MTWSLTRRITVLCAVVGTVIALIAIGGSVAAAGNRRDVDRVLSRVGPASINSEELLSDLYRQQSAVRTYALTADPSELTTYTNARSDELRAEQNSRTLLAGEPALLAALDNVARATERYRQMIVVPIINGTRAHGKSSVLATPTAQSRAAFGVASTAITQLQTALTRVRDSDRRHAEQSSGELVLLLILATVTVVLAGVILVLAMRRLVTRPVLDLAGDVRRVARGDYQYEISASGPPELARLGRDVNAMRERIAADLAEVRAARLLVEETNQRLEQQAEELTRSNRDLEQFAYVASHDLQEPLRKVASFCQLLQRRYAGQLDERADQYIAFAVDGAQRMQRLINDLLAFSRIGRLNTGFTDVDLTKVVGDLATAQTEGTVTVGDLPTVRGEEPLLTALFTNLIGNAIKFRRPDLPPEIQIAAERDGDQNMITVRDNGIGIEPEFAEKVFVIFQRLHPKETYPGTGIGLAISKKIVEYHGGRIWIDLENRGGTLFRITLPVLTPVEEQVA